MGRDGILVTSLEPGGQALLGTRVSPLIVNNNTRHWEDCEEEISFAHSSHPKLRGHVWLSSSCWLHPWVAQKSTETKREKQNQKRVRVYTPLLSVNFSVWYLVCMKYVSGSMT